LAKISEIRVKKHFPVGRATPRAPFDCQPMPGGQMTDPLYHVCVFRVVRGSPHPAYGQPNLGMAFLTNAEKELTWKGIFLV
jgi:hypothetical protein